MMIIWVFPGMQLGSMIKWVPRKLYIWAYKFDVGVQTFHLSKVNFMNFPFYPLNGNSLDKSMRMGTSLGIQPTEYYNFAENLKITHLPDFLLLVYVRTANNAWNFMFTILSYRVSYN